MQPRPPSRTPYLLALCATLTPMTMTATACGGDAGAEQKAIHATHAPAVAGILREDATRHQRGVVEAARRLAPGFAVEDRATRERQMRTALRYVQEPPRGVPEFIASPMSFLAAIDGDGKVIVRDVADETDDHMKGQDFGARYAIVREALANGRAGRELVEFPGETEEDPTSWSMLFVHPVRRDGAVVGAVAAGIPLWRWAQRLSRQLQVEHADQAGLVLWVYVYKGDRLFYHGTPELLDPLVPDEAARAAGLESSPGGFTGQLQMQGRWYGYGVLPVRSVADDAGVIVFASNPP